MWYRVDLLFATRPRGESPTVKCESCNVLFEGESAQAACDKAEGWAARHIVDSDFEFLGVEDIALLFEDKPGDGTEIGGSYFEDEGVWDRKAELIPKREDIPVIRFELNPEGAVRKLITEAQSKGLAEIYGEK